MAELPLFSDFTKRLPGEEKHLPFPHQVENAMWSAVTPVTASRPELIHWSRDMATRLCIDFESLGDNAAQLFTGSRLVSGCTPYAMRYGGHQFGSWAGQLGDGRAISLGEINDTEGQHWVVQLKGAGPTPYSRQGDGFAVLRSSIREYLCSEAMHHLGIPTTRSLSLCVTGDTVPRDIFYDGKVTHEPGAILCRAANSFVRFGSFEIHAAHREHDLLKSLADHVIERNYPHLGTPSEAVYLKWFEELLQRTARLMAQWQRVGFVHAVMNTDNMSILGQTIDYGPYGWLEEYDPAWTPSFIDQQGRRYSYGNQPSIGLWNMYRLANAILPLVDNKPEPLKEILDTYNDYYDDIWKKTVANKLGLVDYRVDHSSSTEDDRLGDELWKTMAQTPTDYTVFFTALAKTVSANVAASDTGAHSSVDDIYNTISESFYDRDNVSPEAQRSYKTWLSSWSQRVSNLPSQDTLTLMESNNPRFILRNYLTQQVIDQAEQGDYSMLDQVSEWIQSPYTTQNSEYEKIRPRWASAKPGCTMLTCSS